MTHADYQKYFEQQAEAEKASFARLPVEDLLTDIRAHRFYQCHQIWYSLAERATPAQANSLLLSCLESDLEYLHRYHCAAALIAINHLEGWEPHQLSAEKTQPVKANLQRIRSELNEA
jgi:hypothetical protein